MHSRNTGGKPELIILWQYSYIASSPSDVFALLVCKALHPQISHRHCSKFSVTSMSIWTSQNSSTISPSVVSELHRCVGKLPGSYSSTISVSWISLYHVSAHSPTLSSLITFTADMNSSSCGPCCYKSHTWAPSIAIPKYTEHFRAYTDLRNHAGCNKRGVNNTYIHSAYHSSVHGGRCHDQCGARPNYNILGTHAVFKCTIMFYYWHAHMIIVQVLVVFSTWGSTHHSVKYCGILHQLLVYSVISTIMWL